MILKEGRVCAGMALESRQGPDLPRGLGAALCLGEDLDVSPEGDWKGTQWDSSYRQITLAQGRRQEQSRGD